MPTVLITGASRGLGREMALAFDKAGYDLILHSNRPCHRVVVEGVPHLHGDLTDVSEAGKLICFLVGKKIDIFINNAAVHQKETFDKTSLENIYGIMLLNLLAPIALIKAIWPIPLLININSLAGKEGSQGELAYCASKHGLKGFLSSLQFDATAAGCRVIDVYLGGMKTAMTRSRPDHDKLIDPVEVAETILQLVEDRKTMRITELTINRRIY